MVLTIREAPVVAVAEMVIRVTPGSVAEQAIDVLGHYDKPALVAGILLFLVGAFAVAGSLAEKSWWRALPVWLVLAALGLLAVALQRGAGVVDTLPVLVGLVTWVTVHSALTDALYREQRRPDLQSPSVVSSSWWPPRSGWQRWGSLWQDASSGPVAATSRSAGGCCACPA